MVTYAERPWTKNYDPGVPKTINYPEMPLHQFLRESAQKAPNRIALISPANVPILGHQARTMTYRELDQLSDALAVGLMENGLKKSDRIAVVLPNSMAFAISFPPMDTRSKRIIVAKHSWRPINLAAAVAS